MECKGHLDERDETESFNEGLVFSFNSGFSADDVLNVFLRIHNLTNDISNYCVISHCADNIIEPARWTWIKTILRKELCGFCD